MIADRATHILDAPKGICRRIGKQFVVELPTCMGLDVKLSYRRDRLYALSDSSNVVVLLTPPPEMPADSG